MSHGGDTIAPAARDRLRIQDRVSTVPLVRAPASAGIEGSGSSADGAFVSTPVGSSTGRPRLLTDGRRSRAGDPGRFGIVPGLPRCCRHRDERAIDGLNATAVDVALLSLEPMGGRHPVRRLRDVTLLEGPRSVRSRRQSRRTHPPRHDLPGRRRRASSPRALATKRRNRGYGPRQAVDAASRWLAGRRPYCTPRKA